MANHNVQQVPRWAWHVVFECASYTDSDQSGDTVEVGNDPYDFEILTATPTCYGCQHYQGITRTLRQQIPELHGELRLQKLSIASSLEVSNNELTERVSEISTAFVRACLERDDKYKICKKNDAIIWASFFVIFCLLLCITVLVG